VRGALALLCVTALFHLQAAVLALCLCHHGHGEDGSGATAHAHGRVALDSKPLDHLPPSCECRAPLLLASLERVGLPQPAQRPSREGGPSGSFALAEGPPLVVDSHETTGPPIRVVSSSAPALLPVMTC
jgi:hypothetical protein